MLGNGIKLLKESGSKPIHLNTNTLAKTVIAYGSISIKML